jgi:hypothetical protein
MRSGSFGPVSEKIFTHQTVPWSRWPLAFQTRLRSDCHCSLRSSVRNPRSLWQHPSQSAPSLVFPITLVNLEASRDGSGGSIALRHNGLSIRGKPDTNGETLCRDCRNTDFRRPIGYHRRRRSTSSSLKGRASLCTGNSCLRDRCLIPTT